MQSARPPSDLLLYAGLTIVFFGALAMAIGFVCSPLSGASLARAVGERLLDGCVPGGGA